MSSSVAEGLLRTYAFLTAQAVIPIVVGSFKSLKTPAEIVSLRRAERKRAAIRSGRLAEDVSDSEWADTEGRSTEDGGDDEDEDSEEEALTWSDTLLFPVMGSVVLLGFYGIIKYVGKEWINRILGVYFMGAGMFAIQSTFSTLIRFTLRLIGRPAKVYHLRISSNFKQVAHSTLTVPTLVLLPLSIGLPLAYIYFDKPYFLSNLIALCLGTAALALLKLDSFATAGLLLGVLLIYDIFWVFATPVMVTVAKSLDAPIKLLAPKPTSSGSPAEYAMLGLGDVVIPGLMIAMCLRFDLAQYAKRRVAGHKAKVESEHSGSILAAVSKPKSGSAGRATVAAGEVPIHAISPSTPFSRPYFWAGIVSYLLGLGTTMAVMHTFRAAQPALLYLSPACFLGPLALAAARGELKDLWAYSETADKGKDKVAKDGEAKTAKGKGSLKSRVDDTIEAGSEVARQAREAARNGLAEVADGSGSEQEPGNGEGKAGDEDESWTEMPNGANGSSAGSRKRKGKKK